MTAALTRDHLERLPDAALAELHALVVGSGRPLPDVAYQRDPIGWARDVLGIEERFIRWSMHPEYTAHTWDGTPDPLAAVCEALGRGERRIGVESATGTGKTFTAGWLPLWFLAAFEDSLVVTVAAKEAQLEAQLWKELGRHWPAFSRAYPTAEKSHLRARLKPGTDDRETWAAIGWVAGSDAGKESATRAQGFHAAHMLIICEEAPGIPVPVMTALRNTSVGQHNIVLAQGNPDHQLDQLHQFCIRPGTVHVRISAYDHPNVVCGREMIPGATTPQGIADLALDWGEGTAMFESRARGVSPAESVDALIKLEWCTRSVGRHDAIGDPALGVDVAQSQNGDKAAIARGRGRALIEVQATQCPNATQLGRDVWAEMQRDRVSPDYVGVDPVGVGAATLNFLNDTTPSPVQPLNGGATPITRAQRAPDGTDYDWTPDANSFVNLRAQMWWQMREDLRHGDVALPKDDQLFRELTTPLFTVKAGKVVVEQKEQIKKRLGGKSPDRADAVVYWNWVRRRTRETDALPPRASQGQDPIVDVFEEFASAHPLDYAAVGAGQFPEEF